MGFGFGQRGAARLATFRVIHKVVDGVEHERVVQFNGPRREILRVGDQVSYVVQPNDALLRLNGAAPPAPHARVFGRRFETMGDVYDVRVAGRGRVVERPAVHLRVEPRHQDRFGYWLWLDEETGLLLASELKDAAGVNLEIFQFTALRLGDRVAEADLRPALDGAVVHRLPPPAAQRPEAAPTWQARWVPPGFELAVAAVRRPPDQPRGVSTLVFSDGLAAFSVFVEAMPEAGAGTLLSRNGATVVVTRSAVGDDGDHLVTVVGEVPIATARRIAAGIAPRGR